MKKLTIILLALISLIYATPALATWPDPNNVATSGTNIDITSLTALTGAQAGMVPTKATVTGTTVTLGATDASHEIFTNGAGCTATLPDATLCANKIFVLDCQTSGGLAIAPHSGQTINGVSGTHLFSGGVGIGAIISDGANWYIFSPRVNLYGSSDGFLVYTQYGSLSPIASATAAGQVVMFNGSVPTWSNTVYSNQSKSTAFALTANTPKHTIITGAATVTITPTANEEWDIYNSGANAVTITTSSGSLLGTNGGSMTADGSSRQYWSDGTNVYCVGANGS